ncbi:hypothetical protein chiPu_0024068, partial [Chiloscyllium punctatum]|nr:hypothetical protein [Chiloscyllium punctatum]
MSGIYRLCLTDKTVNLVKLNSEAAAVVLQLMNIRRCGHSENFFFVEVGRSAVTGPGEFWMQVDDSVLAQNMHETILEAMKAMSEEFRLRSKSQSSGTNPISVPPRRHHPPPSRVGLVARRGAPTSPGQAPGPARTRTPGDGAASSRPPSADEAPCSPPPSQGAPGARPLPPPPPSRSTPDLASSPLGLPRGGFSSSSSLPSSSSDGEGYGSSPGSPGGGGRPLHNYVAMGGLGQRQPQCQLRRRPSSRGGEDEEEEEEADRGLSIRAWSGRLRPELLETGHDQGTDQGYVAMLPNVVAPSDDDYMAMTPKGPSAPHRVESPAGGYVLMSPSGSCSPDWARPPGGGSPGGDYMN